MQFDTGLGRGLPSLTDLLVSDVEHHSELWKLLNSAFCDSGGV